MVRVSAAKTRKWTGIHSEVSAAGVVESPHETLLAVLSIAARWPTLPLRRDAESCSQGVARLGDSRHPQSPVLG